MTKVKFEDVALLAVNDSHGIYAYQRFAHEYMNEAQKQEYPELIEGVENVAYCEAWEDFVNTIPTISHNGTNYNIYEMGDIWLVPVNAEIEWPEMA